MSTAPRQLSTSPRVFFDERNRSIRVDLFEELSHQALAALRSFTRRLGAPHLLEEVILPILQEGDSQILAAVQDRPWPPWGLGARHVVALCQTHSIADDSYAISPVYVTDEDLTNVGMISAVFKEALEQLTTSPRAEVCYLVAEGSTLVDQVLASVGFDKSDDVFVNWAGRYYTYRAPVAKVLGELGLDKLSSPDLLVHDMDPAMVSKNALFHQTMYLGSRAEWASERAISEIIRLVRGGHAGKPGGVPSGTGRFAFDPESIVEVSVANFLGAERQQLLDFIVGQENNFKAATIVPPAAPGATVNEKVRRAKTLDNLGKFEARISERIKEQLQPVLTKLGHKSFPLGRIEMQVTASNDGDYFRLHQDSDPNSTREISFVYFLYREPRRFSGGELRIYESRVIDGRLLPADRSHTLSPRQDAIVFFPSLNEHEVLPVRVPSRAFGDSRFTVNGWIHRQ
jgi:Rps23 Pro-64 3,4-dihydroxylase Tpa1-like proline 4-hydroxylase